MRPCSLRLQRVNGFSGKERPPFEAALFIIHAVQGPFRQIEQTVLRGVAKGRDETLATWLPVGVSWNVSMRELQKGSGNSKFTPPR